MRQKDSNELSRHSASSKNEFANINHRMDIIERLIEFQNRIRNNSHPYFQHVINEELANTLDQFEAQNRDLLDGYIVTDPYSTYTFGINGLRWTKKELLAVSSIGDYWERTEFAERYLDAQFDVIKEKNIKVERIFVVSDESLEKVKSWMKYQKANGVSVYYLNKNDTFFSEKWAEQDFLIQDGELLVDLQAQSHTPRAMAKEIVTTKHNLVEAKYILYEQMKVNAIEF